MSHAARKKMPPGTKTSGAENMVKVNYVAYISNLKEGTPQALDCPEIRDEFHIKRADYERAKVDIEFAKGLVHSVVCQFSPRMLELGPFRCSNCDSANASDFVHNPSYHDDTANGYSPTILNSLAVPTCFKCSIILKQKSRSILLSGNSRVSTRLRQTELKFCSACNKIEPAGDSGNGQKLLQCSRCKVTYYCSKECQRTHWKASHKKTCCKPADPMVD